jgi:hypothetical protein
MKFGGPKAAERIPPIACKTSRYFTVRFDKNITPTETLAARCTVGPFGVSALSALLTAVADAPAATNASCLKVKGPMVDVVPPNGLTVFVELPSATACPRPDMKAEAAGRRNRST